ncbi:MAG TPA: MMPL family transporter [Opitutaceae bacterium]|jgi:predicted exporter
MTPRVARTILATFIAACVLWLVRLDYRQKVSTNVLDLVPAGERSPELAAVRDLADNVQARVVLFVVTDRRAGAPAPVAAARILVSSLGASAAFAQVESLSGAKDEEALGRAVFAERGDLLLSTWLGDQERAFAQTGLPKERMAGWAAERAAAQLEAYLTRPEAVGMEQLIAQDPLLLIAPLVERAQALGHAQAHPGSALVWAQIAASPLSESGQAPVQAAIDRAQAQLAASFPDLSLEWTGVNRFAAASRARIEHEIRWLNLASIAAVLLVGCLFVRRLWKLAHLVPIILCSMLGAWTISTLVFSRLHILVFAIGSLLSGVAIDYGFYIFMRPYASEREDYRGKLRRLLKPLLASCLTTVAGFSLLLFSDLPLIRQVGLFVSAGLLTALGAAMLYFAQLRRPLLEPRRWTAERAVRTPRAKWRRPAVVLALIAVAVAALAPWRLHWDDDIRELDVAQPELRANDESIRAQFGDDSRHAVYLTYGDDIASAREHLAAFSSYLARAQPDESPFSLGLVLPTPDDYSALPRRLHALREFPADFRITLAAHGFRPDSFDGFFNAWDLTVREKPRPTYDQLFQRVRGSLSGPLKLLASSGAGAGRRAWLVTLSDGPELADLPASLGTVSASELQHFNRLFTQYRWSALRLSLIGLALVIASVFAIYPGRRAVRIALIPAGSCFFVFGVMGLWGQTLNLFHLLGAFLGVCLAHNYSIFSSDTARNGSAPPAPVRLSGLCAAASFGVLACSRIPVVHALGLSVCLIVLTALTAIEVEAWARSP